MFIIFIVGQIYFVKGLKEPRAHILENVLTHDECRNIIRDCEKHETWTTYSADGYNTHDVLLTELPNLYAFIENIVYQKLVPEYAAKYNVPEKSLSLDKSSLFFIKYFNDPGRCTSLYAYDAVTGYHKDKSPFSFNIALNDDFSGGGTHFLKENIHVNNPVGSCLIFPGRNTHSGVKVNAGTRCIIYGSLDYTK
jgi:hypothetical protein